VGRRLLALAGAAALWIAAFSALPASAAHTAEIAFPGGNGEFYSPFAGPATITVTVDPLDVDDTFTARLRPTGKTVIASKDFFVDSGDPDGTKVVSFMWPALSVTSARQYDVAVFRHGAQVAVQSFYLHPKLVRLTDIKPDPFLPWIDDGYKDTTKVSFTLASDANAEARVFAATSGGRCCAARVLTEPLGSRLAGANSWTWDGRDDGGAHLPKGAYFVKIWADDGVIGSSVSNAMKVTIARTYRAKATKSKPARNYHHLGPSSPTALGGACLTLISVGNLLIICQSGAMSVYWRWGLSDSERIVGQSFVLDGTEGCPRKIRSTSHTKHQSEFRVYENIDNFGATCSLSIARITYSYPKPS
jgi:FlgD Ig-like domain